MRRAVLCAKLKRMKLSELAALTSARVEGDANTEIVGAAGLEREARSGYVTFLANPRYTPRVNQTAPRQFMLRGRCAIEKRFRFCGPRIVPSPTHARSRLFHPEPSVKPEIHPTACTTIRLKLQATFGLARVR